MPDLVNSFLLSQAIAAVAFGCGVVSFQLRDRRTILLWLSASSFTNACHFFVLGKATPGILFLIIGSRSFTAAFSVSRKVMCLFFAIILGGFYFSYSNPIGFLGLFATLTSTYASFQKTDRRVRLFMMLANISWTIHNLVVWTPVAAAMEATFLVSNLLGYWRFYVRDKAAPGQDPGLTKEPTG
ncbi:MAG: YgjV family protein [Planctomycetota bacterium]|jgi:hypothetical protein|nr:YgjV family protein [Planctomycetota bacterium]MDP7129913.1 YgjV family protein [Planctomycetota bacterium]MDP7253274.1 YgjV family protein [Planctomycetota bacterium]